MRRLALAALAVALPLAVPTTVTSPALAAPEVTAPVLAQAETAPADRPVDVVVETLAPRAPTSADEPLQVAGTLVNRSGDAVSDLRVRLLVAPVLTSRSALAQATEAGDPSSGRVADGRPRGAEVVPADDSLAPGASTSFDLRLEVGELGMSRLGVYPVQVEVRGQLDEDRRTGTLGVASTVVPWFPEGQPRPVRLAFVLPLVTAPERAPDGALLGDRTLREVGEGGRLARLLEAGTSGARGACDPQAEPAGDAGLPPADPGPQALPCRGEPVPVTWAVDPDLLETAQSLAEEHTVVDGTGRAARVGEPAAAQWLEVVRLAVGGTDPGAGSGLQGAGPPGDLLALPFGDIDVVAAARARSGLVGDVEQLRLLGRRTAEQLLGVQPLDTVAWPPAGRVSSAALDAVAGAGARAVVLDPEAMPPRPVASSRTPGARTPLRSTVAGRVDGLVVDDALSQLLTAGPSDAGWQGARLAEQRWLAETAMIAAERPETRTVLVALPRDADVQPAVVGPALADAGRLPWLCPVALAAVAAAQESCALEDPEAPPETEEDRGELRPADGVGELPDGHLQQVAAVRARADQLTDEVLLAGTDPAVETKSRLLRARGRSLSSAWRDDPVGGRLMLGMQRDEVDRLRAQVQLITSGRVLLTSENTVVFVELLNTLDQPVNVGVALNDPVEARLTSSDTGVRTVGPGQQVQVRVGVEARVSGQFVVRATLLDRSGQPFGEPVELVARSTRYGRLALAVTGVAASVLLVAVGVRLVRRAVRSSRPLPDATP